MRVSKERRKLATLLLLQNRQKRYEAGQINQLEVTAYTAARWQSIPQSQMWGILNELCKSRFVKRRTNGSVSVIITYALTKRGDTYINRHLLECINALEFVHAWKIAKFERDSKL